MPEILENTKDASVAKRSEPKRRMRGPQRRATIIEAATQLISERGYEGTSVSDLAEAVGITKAVVYDHFVSKRDIHIEVLRNEATLLMGRIGEAMFFETDHQARVRAGIYAFFKTIKERPYSRVCLQPAPVNDSEIMATQAEIARAGRTSLGMVFAPMLKDQHPQAKLEMFASVVRGAMSEMAFWWDEHPETPLETVAEHTFAQVWNGLASYIDPVPDTSADRPAQT